MLDAIAPGSSLWLLKQVFTKHLVGRSASADFEEDSLVPRLVTLYNEASSWYTQQPILSLLEDNYTKTELLKLVSGLTKFRIDEARKHAFQTKPGELIEPPTITRLRLDPAKVDHFLDFIFSLSFLQDVAYGTKTLKLSNGEKIDIPNVVKTGISSRLIQLYQTYCLESCFRPLGRSTLCNILKVWMKKSPVLFYSFISFTEMIPRSLELSVNEIKANISYRLCLVTLLFKHMIHNILRCAPRPRRSHWRDWTVPKWMA